MGSTRCLARGAIAIALLASGACELDSLLSSGKRNPGSSVTASRLVFNVQPGSARAGQPIAPAVEVSAQDDGGRVDPAFNGQITVALASHAGGGQLAGTTNQNASAGVARFSDLSIDRQGTSYTLLASANGLTSTTSAAFTITPRPPTTITLVSGNAQTDTAGATLTTPYVVRVTDSTGSGVGGVSVTWTVTSGGGLITSANDATGANGEARATHVLGATAGPQTVTASVAGLTGSPVTFTSTATHGAPAEIVFTQRPTNATITSVISPAVSVTIRDRSGNVATGYTSVVSIDIAPGSGTPTARLLGTVNRTPSSGVVTFDDLRVNVPGLNYRLRVTAGSLTATSVTFDVLL
jgi:hypothetical protein